MCLGLFGAGCRSAKLLTDPILGPDFVVANAYSMRNTLPVTLRRVAVLPLSHNERDINAAAGPEMLEPALHAELAKSGRFELLMITPAQLKQWTGQPLWRDTDELPADFLKIVAGRTGSDAVLFSQLTRFKAYPPLVLGWRFKLVSNSAEVWWAVDELFDAGDERVANSARRYERARVGNNPAVEDSRSILLSPSRFGQYTTSAIFQTLPTR